MNANFEDLKLSMLAILWICMLLLTVFGGIFFIALSVYTLNIWHLIFGWMLILLNLLIIEFSNCKNT